MSFATMMVHVDVERDLEQRIQFALRLADRFEAALIGVAGLVPRAAFAAGGIVVYSQPTNGDMRKMTACFEETGQEVLHPRTGPRARRMAVLARLRGEFLAREARAADLIMVGPRHPAGNLHDFVDPGVILLRAGRPVLVVPDIVAPLQLHRAVVAWKDTRECRRAVRDALPLLQQAKEVLLLGIREDETETLARKILADVTDYLVRHGVVVTDEVWRGARGPVATELLHFAQKRESRLDRRRRLRAQPIGRMDIRRRDSRSSDRQPGVLHVVSLSRNFRPRAPAPTASARDAPHSRERSPQCRSAAASSRRQI